MEIVCNLLKFVISYMDELLIGVSTGIVASIIVTKVYGKKKSESNTINYLVQLNNYLADVNSAFVLFLDNENIFCNKLFNTPKLELPINKVTRINKYIKEYEDIKRHIEVTYQCYLLSKKYIAEGKLKYQKEMEEEKAKLDSYRDICGELACKIYNEDIKVYFDSKEKKKYHKLFIKR